MSDCCSLHERREVGEREDDKGDDERAAEERGKRRRKRKTAAAAALVLLVVLSSSSTAFAASKRPERPPDADVGQRVVEDEVGVRHQVQGERDLDCRFLDFKIFE